MALPYVQNAFYDTFGPGYPGQIADWGSLALAQRLRGFITESGVCGRGVVIGTANAQTDHIMTPYSVTAPVAGSTSDQIVGILVRGDATNNDADGNAIPIRYPTMNAVAEIGSDVVIYAEVPAGVTITHAQPVYMSVSHATIPVGAFTNAAGTGLVLVPGAIWYGAAAAGTVGRIQLSPVDNDTVTP